MRRRRHNFVTWATRRIREFLVCGGGCLSCAWMPARPLRQHAQANDDERGYHCRSERAAESEPALVERLVEKISHRGAEWPRQDECCPKERDTRHAGPEVQ